MTRRVLPSQKLPELACKDPAVQGFVNQELRKYVAEVYQQFVRMLVGFFTESRTDSQATITASAAAPAIRLIETDAAANETQWEIQSVSGEWRLVTQNDDGTVGATAIAVNRTGTTVDSISLQATKVRSGAYADPTYFGGNPGFAHAGSGNASFGSFARYESGTAFGVSLGLMKSRNDTPGSHTIVQSGDQVGDLAFFGSDGTNWQCLARIFGEVDGTPGTGDMPGRLTFYTVADGGVTQTERMRIASDGLVTIPGAVAIAGAITHTFSGNATAGLYMESGTPVLGWRETDGSADNKRWIAYASGEAWQLQTRSDDGSTSANVIEVQRTGVTVDSVGVGGAVTLGTVSTTPTHRLNTNTATTVGAAGGASALPATPTGYVIININGTDRKIPYYAT